MCYFYFLLSLVALPSLLLNDHHDLALDVLRDLLLTVPSVSHIKYGGQQGRSIQHPNAGNCLLGSSAEANVLNNLTSSNQWQLTILS